MKLGVGLVYQRPKVGEFQGRSLLHHDSEIGNAMCGVFSNPWPAFEGDGCQGLG